jgi:hypothetical protein
VEPSTPPTPSVRETAPSAYVYAATDERPRGPREEELCKTASEFDWLYSTTWFALDAGAIVLDQYVVQSAGSPAVRLLGPGLIGFMWGGFIGGTYLALPKCSPSLVRAPPPEGEVRRYWPAALALALLAGATAPFIVGIETGTGAVTDPWSTLERSGRLIAAGTAAFGGALVPYLIPPKTWRAAKELERIRVGASASGGFVSYTLRF